jgi:hypothetical protein
VWTESAPGSAYFYDATFAGVSLSAGKAYAISVRNDSTEQRAGSGWGLVEAADPSHLVWRRAPKAEWTAVDFSDHPAMTNGVVALEGSFKVVVNKRKGRGH